MLSAVGDQYAAENTVVIDALTQAIWVPPIGLLGIYLVLLFPDGRLPSRRWRPLAWFSGVVIVLVSVTQGLIPGPLPDFGGYATRLDLRDNPGLRMCRTPFSCRCYCASWLR